MRKIINAVKKKILLSTIIYVVIFVLLKILLDLVNLEYMQWIEYFTLMIVPIGIIAGTVQLLKRNRVVLVILVIFEILLSIIVCGYFLLFLLINSEKIVYRDGKKMVQETHSFLFSNWINYYDYKNIFVRGKNIRIYESYDDNLEEYCYTYYYDDNGKVVHTDNEDYYRDKNIQKSEESNTNPEENTTTNNNASVTIKDEDILYRKDFDENISIRVVNNGYILAQRCIIGIEKTVDGGKTWENQFKRYDGYMQVNNGAEFLFISENIGFINDPGLAGADGENGGLLVTNNGGQTFEKAQIIYPENIKEERLYISDVPFEENGVLKLKTYTLNYNRIPQKINYEFYSEDKGLNWICEE